MTPCPRTNGVWRFERDKILRNVGHRIPSVASSCSTRTESLQQILYILLTYFNNQLNAQFLYSITICLLHYNPRHVSSINMPIFRRTNCIITASGILYSRLQRVTIPDAVIIQFVLLKMGMLMLETCRGL